MRNRPAQLFDRITSKGQKGLQQFEALLKKLSAQMGRDYLSQDSLEQSWQDYDAITNYFLAKSKTFISNQLHRMLLVQSLQSIGFSLQETRLVNKYLNRVTTTILTFFTDSSQKVRLAAIGAIYNLLTKYVEQGKQHFLDTFERLSVLIADPSGQIRQAATFLNQALKTMVYDSVFDPTAFNLEEFVKLLAQRLQTGGVAAKAFMLDWLMAVQEVPQLEISFNLPLFFQQVFELLLSPRKSLRMKAEECLKKFLHVLREILSISGNLATKLNQEAAQIIFEMVLILVRQNLSSDVTFHALEWLQLFTKFFSKQLQDKGDPFLQQIYRIKFKDVIVVVITTLSDECDRVRKIANRINDTLLHVFPLMDTQNKSIDKTSQLLETLLSQSKVPPRVEAILRWVKLFLQNNSEHLLSEINRLIQLIVEKLCDRNATTGLFQLIEESLFVKDYYILLIETLLNYLQHQETIPPEPIFRQILALKNSQHHFLILCQKVSTLACVSFRYRLVQSLIGVLVSENTLEPLRIQLSQSCDSQVFRQLFIGFSINEPAALILCFLVGKYYLAKEFLNLLALEERLSAKNYRSLVRMSNLVEHSNMNHLRADLRIKPTALKAYLSLLMTLPHRKSLGILMQRLPPQMQEQQEMNEKEEVDEEQREVDESNSLLKQYGEYEIE